MPVCNGLAAELTEVELLESAAVEDSSEDEASEELDVVLLDSAADKGAEADGACEVVEGPEADAVDEVESMLADEAADNRIAETSVAAIEVVPSTFTLTPVVVASCTLPVAAAVSDAPSALPKVSESLAT